MGRDKVSERVHGLRDACNAAHRGGADFPTIWKNILLGSGLVAGIPSHRANERGAAMIVPLITGHRLIFDELGFSIE